MSTVADFLKSLTGHGVYKASILQELEQFGFTSRTYMPGLAPTLFFEGRETPVNVRSPEAVRADMEKDAESGVFGMLDNKIEEQVIDAVDLSEAVYALLFPGLTPPGRKFKNRGKAYRANVKEIERGLRSN